MAEDFASTANNSETESNFFGEREARVYAKRTEMRGSVWAL